MKTTVTSIVLALSVTSSFSQVSYSTLDTSNIRARINNNGIFFNKRFEQTAGFEVPKGSGIHAIHSMNIIAAGLDVNNNLKIATTGEVDSDFFFGPVTDLQAQYLTQSYIDRYSALWPVSKTEIDLHIANWQTPGYTIPANILNWPANGDVSNGEPAMIAPFFDRDEDDVYEPADGDYPLIRGDKAIFSVLNDRKNVHPSGGDPLGIEVHLLFYQYDTTGALGNTTFIHTTAINRGTQTLYSFRFGSMVDFDLGGYNDDFVGTSVPLNLAYAYNGDMLDGDEADVLGYGNTPPAVGVMTLNKPLNAHSSPVLPPTLVIDDYNLIGGKQTGGNDQYDDNGEPTRWIYYGGADGWNEATSSNAPGERRSYIGFPEETFTPGAVFYNDYAVIYSKNSMGDDIFSSVDSLFTDAETVQDFYNDQDYGMGENETLGIDEMSAGSLEIYPNPAKEEVIFSGINAGAYEIFSLDGKQVSSGLANGSAVNVSSLQDGCYVVIVKENGQSFKTKLIKQ